MAGVPVPAYKQFWTDKRLSLITQYKDLVNINTTVIEGVV
jgi:hypothetical protein